MSEILTFVSLFNTISEIKLLTLIFWYASKCFNWFIPESKLYTTHIGWSIKLMCLITWYAGSSIKPVPSISINGIIIWNCHIRWIYCCTGSCKIIKLIIILVSNMVVILFETKLKYAISATYSWTIWLRYKYKLLWVVFFLCQVIINNLFTRTCIWPLWN